MDRAVTAARRAFDGDEIARYWARETGVLYSTATQLGRTMGEQLVTDARIDKITFTGSTAAGKHLGALAANRVARITLELGGKSAAVILDDADVQTAAQTPAAIECFQSGQVCASLTRIIVPRRRHNEFLEAAAPVFANTKVGSPFDPASQMGPLSSASQRVRGSTPSSSRPTTTKHSPSPGNCIADGVPPARSRGFPAGPRNHRRARGWPRAAVGRHRPQVLRRHRT